ncbi:MAG: hypothetical protein F4X54_02720 [Chloroflexi bacterium]|nr:hypothetical protein [Chloroflexota bacterium]MYB83658.1 hypothetical protein [Chloroflexota bacterium]
MILVIPLAMLVFAMAAFSALLVHVSLLWVIASLLFAPFAGRMYEQEATAAGVLQDRKTLRRAGMGAGALLIVPWVYMMRDLRGQRTGAWIFHPRAAYLLWLMGPTVFFFIFAIGGTMILLGGTSIGDRDPTHVPAWMYIGMAAAPLSLVSLLRVSSTPLVRSLPNQPWSLLRPYAWTVFWIAVSMPLVISVYLAQPPRPF